jgi:hypothetical protein
MDQWVLEAPWILDVSVRRHASDKPGSGRIMALQIKHPS